MFDVQFSVLFKAVDRLRQQLETADQELRSYLAEELFSLRNLGEQYIDYWMTLDEQIHELLERYQLEGLESHVSKSTTAASPLDIPASEPKLPGRSSLTNSQQVEQGSPSDLPPSEFADWMKLAFETDEISETSLHKGIGYFDLLMYDQAVAFLSDYLDTAEHPIARLFLAAAYAAKRQNNRAQREVGSLRQLTRDPLLICAANEIEAHIYAEYGQYEQAIGLLDEIADVMPEYPDVWYNLGLCFAVVGSYGKSIQCLVHSLRLKPGSADSSRLLTLVLLKAGDLEGAQEVIRLALQHHPRNPDLLLLKSELAWMEQRFDEGVEACRTVLNMNPQHPTARRNLAKGLLLQGRVSDAVGVLKMQLSVHPKDPAVLVQLAVANLLIGQYDRAEQCVLNSMISYPDQGFLWLILGRVSALKNDAQQAYYRFVRALRDTRKPVKRLALYLYGLTLFEEKQYAESEKYLKAAQVLGTQNPAITILLAKTAKAQGRAKEAERLLESMYQTH